jgi:hypothetical protein
LISHAPKTNLALSGFLGTNPRCQRQPLGFYRQFYQAEPKAHPKQINEHRRLHLLAEVEANDGTNDPSRINITTLASQGTRLSVFLSSHVPSDSTDRNREDLSRGRERILFEVRDHTRHSGDRRAEFDG